MNMPGFTAEASVYKTSGHYHREAGWAGTVDNKELKHATLQYYHPLGLSNRAN